MPVLHHSVFYRPDCLPATQPTANYIHHACISFVGVHQMAPPQLRSQTSNCSLLLTYQPQRDETLSWPVWLTDSRRFTHISGHPSATAQAQDRESLLAKDQRSTAVPHNRSNCRYCKTNHKSNLIKNGNCIIYLFTHGVNMVQETSLKTLVSSP